MENPCGVPQSFLQGAGIGGTGLALNAQTMGRINELQPKSIREKQVDINMPNVTGAGFGTNFNQT